MNITLSVERLVLEGLPLGPEALPRLQAELEAELTRLLGQGGLDPGLLAGGAVPWLNSVPQLRAGDLALAGPGDPAQLGVQIARAVYAGLGGGAGDGGAEGGVGNPSPEAGLGFPPRMGGTTDRHG